jgi:predicted SAM-dependent methyltransferase
LINNIKLLNLGCGPRFHEAWINLDFHSVHPCVKQHNLLKGIPYPDDTFDVIYHSHVLEHFTKKQAQIFMKECFRALKPGGIIRVIVPDLEGIVQTYLKELSRCINGNIEDEANYDWMMLELFDQTIRNESGGEMAKYLSQKEMINETFVFSRIGEGFRELRAFLLNEGANQKSKSFVKKKITLSRIIRKLKTMIPFIEYRIGNFRRSGEIHQWMYDRFSLKRLLESVGFIDIIKTSETESRIPDWSQYGLDVKDGVVHAPNSLIMEAVKPIMPSK